MNELKVLAAANYKSLGCLGKAEFDQDFFLPRKIANIIRRWKRGGNINFRVLLNFVIVYFNVFEHDFAVRAIYDITTETEHPEIKSLLIALNKTRRSDYVDIEPNRDFYELIYRENQ